MNKHIVACLSLSLLLSLSAFSCGSSDSGSDTTASDSIKQSDSAESDSASSLVDDLPDIKFDGYEFKFFTGSSAALMYAPESESGDIVNDAVYRRNRTVEERFDIKIKTISSGALNENDQRKEIDRIINAGDEICDVILNFGKHLANQAVSGYFYNLYDIDHLNFDKPWWSAQLVDDLTFMDGMYFCSNNLHYEEFAASKVFYFNKNAAEDYKLGDLYSLVFDGKWTIDKMISMTKDVYKDVNGSGTPDKEDFYGLLTTISHNSWSVVFNIPEWDKKSDSIELVAMSDKMLAAFDKISSWFFESSGIYKWNSYVAAKDEMRQMFKNGRGMFAFGFIGDSGTYYRDADIDYGILPFPKYDEKQENYRVFLGANTSNMFAVPAFASNTDRTGIIIEALSAEGYKQLIPVYYETALKDNYLRDVDSVKMLDLITAARTISFSYCYDNWTAGLGFGNCYTSGANGNNYASFYAERENLVLARIDEVVKAFKQ